MIKKDIAQPHSTETDNPRLNGKLIFDEVCGLCDREIPEGSLVLRHETTKNIICLVCLAEIAEINP